MKGKIARFGMIHSVLLMVVLIQSCSTVDQIEHTEDTYKIIPMPQKLVPGNGYFEFSTATRVNLSAESEELKFLGTYLSQLFESAAGFPLEIGPGSSGNKGVWIHLDESYQGTAEAYELRVTSSQISIRANYPTGLLYGVQTVRQLLPKEIESKIVTKSSWRIPAVEISDEPRFEYRGMQMDVSRHFFSVAYLKTFIDRLALFKFNRFHMHLTDDQGWRLQINRYPELTETGAWRTMNDHDEVCIENAKTNPDFELPREFFKMKDGLELYGGYYTQYQMREVIDYAAKRGVVIVPEIDMPGHMKAAIDSFEELSCVDGAGWGETFSIPLCPCKEEVYEFAENVLAEVVDLFPGEYIHIGADEVEKSTWANSALCQELMKAEGLSSVEELQSYFVKRIEAFLNKKGKKMIGWDEALEGGINSSTTIMYWRGWVPEAPVEAAHAGHDVIMTPTSHCYFDYVPDNTNLSHVYSFDPIPEKLKGQFEGQIKGVQANLWSEYIPTPERLEFMSMPRMMALAEVAWTNKKDESSFMKRLDSFYHRLDVMDINYRLPDIDDLPSHVVFIDTASLTLTKPSVIDEIRYTSDGTTPTKDSRLYEGKLKVDKSTDFKIATFKGDRRVTIYDLKFDKQSYKDPVNVQTQPGLSLKYYESNYSSVREIFGSSSKVEVSATVEIPAFVREDEFGLVFKGYIDLPETAIYTFYITSDDGSTVEIGGKKVIDNDGRHAPKEVKGQVALKQGTHPITVKFFESGGGQGLSLNYHISGFPELKKKVSADMLGH